ncbi:MAG: hypothetical protein RIA65_16230 [Woeseia sp.]
MTKLESILKRVRALNGDSERVCVETDSGIEKMTSTQAFRYSELRQLGHAEAATPTQSDQAWYSFAEASSRLGCAPDVLLQHYLTNKLNCYVPAAGLRGAWTQDIPATPKALALRGEDIAEISAYGSVNLDELLHPDNAAAVFKLQARTYVDVTGLRIPHPLPQAVTGNE